MSGPNDGFKGEAQKTWELHVSRRKAQIDAVLESSFAKETQIERHWAQFASLGLGMETNSNRLDSRWMFLDRVLINNNKKNKSPRAEGICAENQPTNQPSPTMGSAY